MVSFENGCTKKIQGRHQRARPASDRMDGEVSIKFDSRQKKWSNSGDTRKVTESWKKNDKYGERKQKRRLQSKHFFRRLIEEDQAEADAEDDAVDAVDTEDKADLAQKTNVSADTIIAT